MTLRARLVALLLLAAAPAGARVARPFPPGFLWGTAIAGFQSDMGVGAPNDDNSDWWVWVRDPANVMAHRVSGDLPENGPGFYALYAHDARLARGKLHGNALRLSIEWSRIFPTSTAGVDISGGITPAALAALDALAGDPRLDDYQPYWAARAGVLARVGDRDAADVAYERAIGLETDPAVRRFLERRRAALGG